MHDRDSDKELTEMIARATSVGPIPRRLMTTAAERTLFGTPELEPVPGTDLVPYEPAGKVELRNQPRVPDTISPATSERVRFEAEVHEGLDQFVRMLRTYPMTAKTPEFRVEVRNKLEEAVEALERAS